MAAKTNGSSKTPEKRELPKGRSTMATTIIIKYDCGFPNVLFIRGHGCSSLCWEKGTPLHNVKKDEWIWETDETFNAIYFKILINDQIFELGEDHQLICGNTLEYTPLF